MKEHEIATENKLIAKFMGGVLHDPKDLYGIKVWSGYPPIEGRLDLPASLRFHESWDWLIPVVDKIRDLQYYAKYKNPNSNLITDKKIHINTKFIRNTWGETVNFIQWYNKISTK